MRERLGIARLALKLRSFRTQGRIKLPLRRSGLSLAPCALKQPTHIEPTQSQKF